MDPTSLEIRAGAGAGPAGSTALDGYSVAQARSARALALAQAGRHVEADQDMAAALDVTPDSAWAYVRQARLRLLCDDLAGMTTALLRALEQGQPPLTQSQRALAETLLRLG